MKLNSKDKIALPIFENICLYLKNEDLLYYRKTNDKKVKIILTEEAYDKYIRNVYETLKEHHDTLRIIFRTNENSIEIILKEN